MACKVDRNPLTLPSILGALKALPLRGRCLQTKPQKYMLLLAKEGGSVCPMSSPAWDQEYRHEPVALAEFLL